MATQTLLSIDDALAVIGAHVVPLPIEHAGLDDAYGRVLAEGTRRPKCRYRQKKDSLTHGKPPPEMLNRGDELCSRSS